MLSIVTKAERMAWLRLYIKRRVQQGTLNLNINPSAWKELREDVEYSWMQEDRRCHEKAAMDKDGESSDILALGKSC
jgi:hypothetical protein